MSKGENSGSIVLLDKTFYLNFQYKLDLPVTVAPDVLSGPSERPASSSQHSSVSAPPSLFHSDAASPHTPCTAEDKSERSDTGHSFIWHLEDSLSVR